MRTARPLHSRPPQQPLSGVEYFLKIRERRNVPVLFLTSSPEEVEEELAHTNRKPDGFVISPFSQRLVVQPARMLLNGWFGASGSTISSAS